MSSFVILSYGRSGSVLLAHNVGRNVGFLPTYAKSVTDLGSPVVHTHLMLPADKFAGYQRIFNLRADPVETVLSYVIADHYKKYHKFKDQDLPSQDPFFVDLTIIDRYCHGLTDWHNHYAAQLTNNDLVVIYEHMVDNLITSVYDRIYPDKSKILLNYSEARHICKRYQDRMLGSVELFLLHKNTQDIKTYINYDI
jgi:DNA polymerase III epsilon subunit-like protein